MLSGLLKRFRPTSSQKIRNYTQKVYQSSSHCGFCGVSYTVLEWPRKCSCCGNSTFRNPIPVAVGLVPIKKNNWHGILLTKRAIKPFVGELCLPGGFVNYLETWQEAISREIKEETSIITDPDEFQLVNAHSTPDHSRILIFGLTSKIRTMDILENFQPNDEVSSILVGDASTKLCFSLHQSIYDDWFKRQTQRE